MIRCVTKALLLSMILISTMAPALTEAAGHDAGKAASATQVIQSLAPTGRLRIAINYGNAVLAQRDPATGELKGVSVDLARELGRRLHVPVDLVPYPAAGDVFAAIDRNAWDVAFLAIQPERATKVDFSAPYLFIDGTYLVRRDSPYQRVADLDRDGVKIAVSRGAAYDLFLSRTLKHAQLVRAASTPATIDLFINDKQLDAAAGIRQALVAAAGRQPGLRVLPDRFSRIEQAMAVPRGHVAGARYLRQFLEEMKSSGRLRAILHANGQDGAVIAPAAESQNGD